MYERIDDDYFLQGLDCRADHAAAYPEPDCDRTDFLVDDETWNGRHDKADRNEGKRMIPPSTS